MARLRDQLARRFPERLQLHVNRLAEQLTGPVAKHLGQRILNRGVWRMSPLIIVFLLMGGVSLGVSRVLMIVIDSSRIRRLLYFSRTQDSGLAPINIADRYASNQPRILMKPLTISSFVRMLSVLILAAGLAASSGCGTTPWRESGLLSAPDYFADLIPADTTALWLSDGNAASDTVLIYSQGGPADSLGFERDGRTSLRYLPGYDRYAVAYVHQAQTLNPSMYTPREDFPLDEASRAVRATSEILHRAIRYHKDRGKTVFVAGTSYGAFVIQHYLATNPSEADRYLILAGRIDMSRPMVDETLEGWAGGFQEDGTTYVHADRLEAATDQENWNRLVKNRLKAAIGLHFSEELAGVDLSNVVYYYATNDEAVGSLTRSEVEFLEAGGATVHETSDGHSQVLYRFIDAVMAGDLSL
ncbi:MAG: pimeloyl-ACP methyl ester carboxylesterase [Thalassolituus oleivorans]